MRTVEITMERSSRQTGKRHSAGRRISRDQATAHRSTWSQATGRGSISRSRGTGHESIGSRSAGHRSIRSQGAGYQVDACAMGQFAWRGLLYCGAAMLLAAAILGGIWFMKHTEHGMMIVLSVCAVTGIALFLSMGTEERSRKPRRGTGRLISPKGTDRDEERRFLRDAI